VWFTTRWKRRRGKIPLQVSGFIAENKSGLFKKRPHGVVRQRKGTLLSEIITTATGLQYEDITVGDGASPRKGGIVTVHYTGTFPDGRKFDSSRDRDEPFAFVLGMGQVIRGWDEGVASMKVGGRRKLILPPDLAYGARGAGRVIPPNATLHFDVELLEVGE